MKGSLTAGILIIVILFISMLPACAPPECDEYDPKRFVQQAATIIKECDEGTCHPWAERVAMCELYRALGDNPLALWSFLNNAHGTFEEIEGVLEKLEDDAYKPLNDVEALIATVSAHPVYGDSFENWVKSVNDAFEKGGPLPEPDDDIEEKIEDQYAVFSALAFLKWGMIPSRKGTETVSAANIVIKMIGGIFQGGKSALEHIACFASDYTFEFSQLAMLGLTNFREGDQVRWPVRGTGYNTPGNLAFFNENGYCVGWGYENLTYCGMSGMTVMKGTCVRDPYSFCGRWVGEEMVTECGSLDPHDLEQSNRCVVGLIDGVPMADCLFEEPRAIFRHPAGDHTPDETFDLSSDYPLAQSAQISEPGTPCENGSPCAVAASPSADVAVLTRGFPSAAGELLQHNGIDYNLVDVSLASSPALMRYPVLIIPSGGLYGKDSSPSFKRALESYASAGGVIIAGPVSGVPS